MIPHYTVLGWGLVYITFKKGMRVDLVQQGVAFELRLTKDED